MKMNLAMDFLVDKESNSITIKREFAAPLQTVWEAFTKSEILDQWWAPAPWKAQTKKMDFREGGQWQYAMLGPEGEVHWALAQFTKIIPLVSYSGLDAFSDAEGNINKEMPQSQWDVSFSKSENKTLVFFRISYNDLAQLEATIQMGFKEGITIAMEGLDALLAK
ncbi:MAG: SRPBCC domain-containing protein [Bacteroidetes bacterium]|nr:MAG: SRPBCC domain-containing protein [Bacteroidota bacterium]